MKKNLIQLHTDDWLDDFQQRMLDLAALYPQAHVYCLIDCAFSALCYAALKQQRHILQWRSLFDLSGDLDERLAEASPTLVPLHSNAVSSWRAVLRRTNGMPMVSVIVTQESLDALAQRLKVWCVVDADGEDYCFRFSDTRRLPDIVATLTPAQHGQFFGPARGWIYRDRNAQWASLSLPEASLPVAEEVHLDSDQCACLIGASTADEIMANLSTYEPALIQAMPHGQVHEAISDALARAHQSGIHEEHFHHWCGLWLRRPSLGKSPEVAQWLDEHQTGERSYEQLMSALESHDMQA